MVGHTEMFRLHICMVSEYTCTFISYGVLYCGITCVRNAYIHILHLFCMLLLLQLPPSTSRAREGERKREIDPSRKRFSIVARRTWAAQCPKMMMLLYLIIAIRNSMMIRLWTMPKYKPIQLCVSYAYRVYTDIHTANNVNRTWNVDGSREQKRKKE